MKLDTTCSQKLEFNVEVEGVGVSDLKPRLLLKDTDLSFLVEGVAEGSKIVFQTPILSKKSTANILEGKVEVVVKDRLLTVWEGKFEIDCAPVVKVTEAKIEGITKDTVVKISPVEITTPKQTVSIKQKVEAAPPRPVVQPKTFIDHSDPIEQSIDRILG